MNPFYFEGIITTTATIYQVLARCQPGILLNSEVHSNPVTLGMTVPRVQMRKLRQRG
jgi:hypothetical protein